MINSKKLEYSYPKELKKLRACVSCHLIKTEEQVIKKDILIKFQFSLTRRDVKIAERIGTHKK
jgi:hypothetical protein